MKDLKVVFMGTPDFAVNILKMLIDHTNVVLVVSQPDKLVGRKRILTPSPVKKLALENGIEVFTPAKVREDYGRILEVDADIIITCAYGQIIPKQILDNPRLGCINVHASLLPKYRGGAPIHRAIMNGDSETGITIMYMDEHMDTGDIISMESTKISPQDNLDSLSDRLSIMGSELLYRTLPSIIDGSNDRVVQNEDEVTFASIIKKEDEKIDFNRLTKQVFDHIRALSSKPGAYFTLDGKIFKVFASRMGDSKGSASTINNIYKDGIGIGTSDGEIIITKLQPEGKKVLDASDYLRGIKANELKGKVVNDREN